MPDKAQIYAAMRAADAAGDGDTVRKLGAYLKQIDTVNQPPANPKAKDDSAVHGFTLGAIKPIDNLASAAEMIPGVKAIDKFGQSLGMPSIDHAVASNDAARANNSRTGFQTVGNIAGTLPVMRLPGGAFAQNTASGALLSDSKDLGGVLTDAAIGGVAGKATSMLGNGLAYLAKPVVSKGARILADAGVPLTIGQIAAGGKSIGAKILNKGEEALTSVFGLGDMINAARDRGTERFNVALGNRVLSNIGVKLPADAEAGSDMVKAVGKTVSDHYNALVPNLHGVFDNQFGQDISAARKSIKTLPDAKQKQFMSILRDVFGNRVDAVPGVGKPGTSLALPGAAGEQSDRTISSQALKDAESRLTFLIGKYGKSLDPDQSIMAGALGDARDALRGMVQRNNPAHANELQALNKAWAQFKTFEKASNAPGNATGVVTPAQALSAARNAGFDDPFVKAAKQLLPNSTPDSGTARRGAITIGAMALGGGAGAATISPAFAAPAAASLLYTQAGQKILNKLAFAPRGKAAGNTAVALRTLANATPVIVPPYLASQRTP